MIAHTILYVSDQNKSTELYAFLLGFKPTLHVPGMTEFKLSESHILGLMPEAGIKRLLGDALPDPSRGKGIPRVELYLRVESPETAFDRAIHLGLKSLSPVEPRDWGMRAGYVMDPDGHVIAFSS